MSFTVTVQPSGRTFQVDRDEPILSAAIRQGVGLPYGCKDGACGSCKSKLLEGRVIHGVHQSKALSAEEEGAGDHGRLAQVLSPQGSLDRGGPAGDVTAAGTPEGRTDLADGQPRRRGVGRRLGALRHQTLVFAGGSA